MSDHAALRRAIIADPDEDTPRLAYADWLDENRPDRKPSPAAGPSAWAEFIRVQCRLAAGAFDDPDYPELLEREQDLAAWLNTHDPDPKLNLPDLIVPRRLCPGEWEHTRRGFTEMLAFDESCGYDATAEEVVEKLAAGLEHAFTRTPARTLRLEHATLEEVARLTAHPIFEQLRGLYMDWLDEGEDDAIVALATSPRSAGLRRLYLDFPVSAGALAVLGRSRHLTALESLVLDYPALGADQVRALGRARWLRHLKRLHLWIEDGAALDAVAELPRLPRLVSLTLRHSVVPGAAALRRFVNSRSFPALAHLDLSGEHLPPDKVALLAQGQWRLRHLALDRNEVRGAGCEALAAASFASTLRVLGLRECDITASGVQTLAAAESLAGLRHLDLSDNPIGAGGLAALAASSTLRGLRVLGLRRTSGPRGPITGRDVTRFLAALHMPGLRHLHLSSLPIGIRGARVLADQPTFANLTRLGLERCRLSEAAVEALVRSPYLTNLVVLELGWNRAGSGAAALASRRVFPRLAWCSLVFNRLGRATGIRVCRRPGVFV